MSNDDILRIVRERPFRPFRILLNDGTTQEVRHPGLVLPSSTRLYVGIPLANYPPPAAERIVIVPHENIVQIEYITPTATASAG